MRYDEPRLVWTRLTTTLVNAGARASVWKEGDEKKGSACEGECVCVFITAVPITSCSCE
jgi:hypothetical protein